MGKPIYESIYQERGIEHPELVGKEVELTCGIENYNNLCEITNSDKSEGCKPTYIGQVLPGGDLFAYKQKDGEIKLIVSKISKIKGEKVHLNVYHNFLYGPIINSIDWLNEKNQQICKNTLENKLNKSSSKPNKFGCSSTQSLA
jgi:hypothetical protein